MRLTWRSGTRASAWRGMSDASGGSRKCWSWITIWEWFEPKPGALAGSTALAQWRAQGRWPASYDRYWEVLQQRAGKQAGTRAMIEILLLGQQYGAARLRQAIDEALQLGCSDAAAVQYLLTAD